MKIYSTVLRALLVPIAATVVGIASAHEVANSVLLRRIRPAFSATASVGWHSDGSMVPGLPFGASEVVKMYQGGIGKDIIINYIDSAVLPFHLSADNIIYLQTLGVPQEITKAVLVRDGQLQQQAAMYAQQMAANPANQMAPPPQQGQQQEPVLTPSTPPPVVSYPQQDYYDSGYPNYDAGYPYYYGGWWPGYYPGWGWGGFRGGFRGGFGGFHGGVGGFHGGGGGFHGGGGGFHGGGGHGGGGGGGGHR